MKKILTLRVLFILAEMVSSKFHWIGAHFCVSIFLDSRDKSLNVLKRCQNDQNFKNFKMNDRTKEEQKERPCCGIHFKFTKYTVWPRNESSL